MNNLNFNKAGINTEELEKAFIQLGKAFEPLKKACTDMLDKFTEVYRNSYKQLGCPYGEGNENMWKYFLDYMNNEVDNTMIKKVSKKKNSFTDWKKSIEKHMGFNKNNYR